MLFSASTDKTVGVWDSETGERIKRLKGHTSFVNTCYPARRGPQLVCTGSDDGTVKVNINNNKQHRYQILNFALFSNFCDIVTPAHLSNCDCHSFSCGTFVRKGQSTLSRTPIRSWPSLLMTPATRSCLEASTMTSRYWTRVDPVNLNYVQE